MQETDTSELIDAITDDDGTDWHIERPWDPYVALCGEELPHHHPSIPDAEVPDEQTCHKCLSISKSVLFRHLTLPLMKLKVRLVG